MLDSLSFYAATAAVLISAAIYGLIYLHSNVSHRRSFWKTLPVGVMAVFIAYIGGGLPLALALSLSALGDFFLSRGEKSFTAGLLSFLSAHLIYIWVFWQLAESYNLSWGHAIMALYALIYGAYLWPKTGVHRISVLVYIFVITLLVSTALMLPAGYGLVVLGSFVFAFSDSMLALEMFVITNPKLRLTLSRIVWVSYIVAQSLIVVGLL